MIRERLLHLDCLQVTIVALLQSHPRQIVAPKTPIPDCQSPCALGKVSGTAPPSQGSLDVSVCFRHSRPPLPLRFARACGAQLELSYPTLARRVAWSGKANLVGAQPALTARIAAPFGFRLKPESPAGFRPALLSLS